LVDTEVFGSMKPAVKIRIGEQQHETANAKGKQPTWNQTIVFENVEPKNHITLTLVDKEMIGDDDVIGSAVTTVEALKNEKIYTLEVANKGKKVGSLRFDVKQYYE